MFPLHMQARHSSVAFSLSLSHVVRISSSCVARSLSDPFLKFYFGVNNILYPIHIPPWTSLSKTNLSGCRLAMTIYAANLPHLERTEDILRRLVLLQAPQATAMTLLMGVAAVHDLLWPRPLHGYPQSVKRTSRELCP